LIPITTIKLQAKPSKHFELFVQKMAKQKKTARKLATAAATTTATTKQTVKEAL
jgi:hypothetical protein